MQGFSITDLVVAAVLLAGLYATMAYGLGLIYGVLRVVNLNHGGVIMAGAYVGLVMHERFGLDPYLCIPIVLVVSFALGIAIYLGLVQTLIVGGLFYLAALAIIARARLKGAPPEAVPGRVVLAK